MLESWSRFSCSVDLLHGVEQTDLHYGSICLPTSRKGWFEHFWLVFHLRRHHSGIHGFVTQVKVNALRYKDLLAKT